MTLARLWLVALVLALMTTSATHAEDKWSFKKLVPSFSKKEVKPKPKGPSTLTKLNNNTKALFAKTKVLVPPWLMPKTQDRVRRSSGTAKTSATRIGKEVRTARRNILLPWLDKQEPADKPTTVPEFLKQKRPGSE